MAAKHVSWLFSEKAGQRPGATVVSEQACVGASFCMPGPRGRVGLARRQRSPADPRRGGPLGALS